MKKVFLVLLSLVFALSLCSCGDSYSEYEDREGEYVDEVAEAEARDAEYAYNAMLEAHPNGIDWTEVKDHVGEYVYFFGEVMDVDSESADGNPTFVDVGGIYPDDRVTGVIWPECSSVFSDIHDIKGEYICMSGTVYMYNGTPNIELTDLSQIEVFRY